MSFLTHAQRLKRIETRLLEIGCWRARARKRVADWTVDGAPIAPGERWPTRDGVLVFEAKASVPADWALADVELEIDLGGESLLSLDEGGGKEVSFGHDPYHRAYPVAARSFTIRSRSVARRPFGEPVREPRLGDAWLVLLDGPVHDLHLLLRQVTETIGVIGDHEAAEPLLGATERALASLRWPSATDDYVARTAPLPLQQRIWALPDLAQEPAGLDEEHRESVVAARDRLRSDLQALKERFPPNGKIAVTGHAHIDLAWLWPYDETKRKVTRTFHTALRLMERFPNFLFNQSTAAYYDEVERTDPALFEAIRARVAEGRWETVGGMWVEPDTNMPTGESFVRQVLYGQRYFEEKFGVRHRVCWLPDCFGFSPALPQLLRQGGIDSFFTIKVNWSETNRFPYDLFWWEGLDGSRVLTHTFDNPVRGYNGTTEPEAILKTWRNFRGKAVHDESLLAIGYGDGGGGVTPEMLERQEQLADFPVLPALGPTRIEDFFARAHARAADAEMPSWLGEMYLELHRATLTTQGRTKKLHREAENALIAAETVSTLAHLLGAPMPASLEASWRFLLKNQFHDILPGSSIREVYEDAERELAQVRDDGLQRQSEALAAIGGLLPEGDDGAILVVNPSAHARSVEIEGPGGVVSSGTKVAPLGIRVLSRREMQPAAGLSAAADRLENEHLQVVVAKDGTIESLLDKASGREAFDGRGNQIWAYPLDKPRNWDAWDVEEDYRKGGEEILAAAVPELIESGPHRAAIRVERRYRNSTIRQTLILGAASRRLDIHTEIDWHDRRVFVRALFPLAVRSDMATYECAFGVVRRPTHGNTSWDAARFEVAAHRFADLSEPGFGVAVLNDGKYGHSAQGGTIGLSLLRSPIYPDPSADESRQAFTYAVMPHSGDWVGAGVREEAENLNRPLVASPVDGSRALAAAEVAPITLRGYPVALAGLKPAEIGDGGVVLRFYEPAGGRGTSTVEVEGWRPSEEVDILENSLGAPRSDIRPFEVRSLRLRKD